MNSNKFAFIICTNNDLFLNECLNYISLLNVPEGYETDILTIKDAHSITSGYNEGMKSSDAKYKIYMHQDVFILNRNFLFDILSIFNSDISIGMVGIVGYEFLSPTGTMWHEERKGLHTMFGVSHTYPNSVYTVEQYNSYKYDIKKDGISDVALIDGMMMVTACDIDWNEEELKDWDFYDAYQSIAFLEKGLRVVVPNQTFPWIIHDDGRILSVYNYDKYRQMFLKKYSKYIGKKPAEIRLLNSVAK